MHPVIYPDKSAGSAAQIQKYILDTCKQHQQEKRALAFAFIISDLDNPHVNKILRDDDYVSSLHNITGHYLTIFFLNDRYVNKLLMDNKDSNAIRLEFTVERIDAPPTVQPKQLARLLIAEDVLKSPSVLFFQVENNTVSDYFVTRLRENKIEDGFIELKSLIKTAVDSFEKVTDENKANYPALFELLRNAVNGAESWKKAKRTYEMLIRLKDFIFLWK